MRAVIFQCDVIVRSSGYKALCNILSLEEILFPNDKMAIKFIRIRVLVIVSVAGHR